MFVVEQQGVGQPPFQASVVDSAIISGTATIAFLNAGGELNLENISVQDSNINSITSTGSTAQNAEGATFVRGVRVTGGSFTVRATFWNQSQSH